MYVHEKLKKKRLEGFIKLRNNKLTTFYKKLTTARAFVLHKTRYVRVSNALYVRRI